MKERMVGIVENSKKELGSYCSNNAMKNIQLNYIQMPRR
jgi:hypothetical protein